MEEHEMKRVKRVVVVLLLCIFIIGVFQPVYAGIVLDRIPHTDDRIAGGDPKKKTELSFWDLMILHFDFIFFRR
jgi:hypothetical protein